MKKPGPEWAKMRAQHLKTYPLCHVCFDNQDLVVHHLRYRGKRGVSEQPGDLVTMCKRHHDALHAFVGPGRQFVADALEKSLAWMEMMRDATFAEIIDSARD